MVMANNLVQVEKTKPQIIFEPLGKLVTQFTYANIKIHLDLKPLQEEVLDLSLIHISEPTRPY